MRYVLENEQLIVEVDSFGAELKSVRSKNTSMEYMWQADPTYWGRTSPVLFPFVGSLKNKEYRYNGTTYPMGQHGFARDMEHTLISQTDSAIWFSMSSTADTLQKYPFPFVLKIGYELSDNTLTVLWQVENPADTTMYFSIGAHPAFRCPIHGEPDKTGYHLYFDGVEEIHHHGNNVATGMALREDLILPLVNHRVAITPEFFDRCTYMIEGAQTTQVGLEDAFQNRIVTVDFDTPLFAIWSPEGKNAPFLCIEPWYGRCDADDFNGTLEEREFTNKLSAKDTFKAQYKMTFH